MMMAIAVMVMMPVGMIVIVVMGRRGRMGLMGR